VNIYITIGLAFAVACAISAGMTPLTIKFAHKVGAIDVPKDNRRMHKIPTPRLGGLAISFGFLFSLLVFTPISNELRAVLLGSVIIVIMGAIDDIVTLKPIPRLFIQIFAAAIPVVAGVRIDFFSNPNVFSSVAFLNLHYWSIPITIIWIVGLTNAVNMIDGLDGLTVGVSSIAAFSLLAISIIINPFSPLTIAMAALAGSCVGFIPFNFNPAKIFMGDTGAMFLGYILATMSIMGLFKFYAVISFAVPFLILGLPIFDMLFAILRRLLRGKNPLKPDRGHLHHRLIDLGMSQKQAVALLYAISGVLGLSAVVLTSSGEMRTLLLLLTVFIVVLVAMKLSDIGKKKK